MKKTIGLIVTLVIALVMLTGCVNVNYEVKVNKDGTGEISYLYVFSKDSLNSLQVSAEDMVKTMKEQAEKNGYNTEIYEDDTSAGFKASKHLNNLTEDFSLQEAFGEEYVKDNEEEKDNRIKIKNNLFRTTIAQDAEIDLTGMKDIATIVTMNYTVKLPVKANSNNATEVSKNGKELTWNLTGGEINKIEYLATGINVLPIVLIVLLVIIAIGVVLYLLVFRKKDKKEVKKEAKKVEKKNIKKEDKKEEKQNKETK